jgi:anti-sigma B factor antagonist
MSLSLGRDRHAPLSATATELSPNTIVLTLVGEIDIANVDEMKEALTGAYARYDRVVVDLTRVSFVSCGGLGVLREAHQHTELIVVAETRMVLRALRATKLDEVLTVHTEPLSTLFPDVTFQS